MSSTLLFDLDDTLLKNNIDLFLPKYLHMFSAFDGDRIKPELFVKSLLAGTEAMIENRQPDRTLKEVFESVFFPLTGADPAEFHPVADQFYDSIFPELQSLTGPIPQAVPVVCQAMERGYRLAVTTNPLFPRCAVEHRLAWAGLPADQFKFSLVTTYETFHFSKPDTAYFAEVMGRLGWPDEPVVVVGDDHERDISSAGRLGLATFCVSSPTSDAALLDGSRSIYGTIDELLPWIDRNGSDELKPEYTTPESLIAIIRSTPAVIDSFCRALPLDHWPQRPSPGEWSLTEILCHLRDVDQEVNLPRIKTVLQSENPFLPGEDTDRWSEQRQYHLQDGFQALQQFFHVRQELVSLIESMSPQDWQSPARHAIFGPTRLQEIINILAAHDRLHVRQIRQVLEQVAPELLDDGRF